MKESLGPRTIGFPTPVFIVGSYDDEGKPNIMNAAAAGMCCFVPPCIYVSLRQATYTYHNIMKRNAFTVSIPPEKYVEEADYLGLASGKKTDKFKVSGLTPVKSKLVDAPYVNEFPVVLECKLKETVNLGSHTMFIGEVLDLKANEEVLIDITSKSGKKLSRIDPKKFLPIIFDMSTRNYYIPGKKIGNGFSDGSKLLKNK
ncbi:flavin reductase family protein [Methanobacterium sp.]|uniref:flavin reductase family protein n=1 Tax=Methanobacterium sp. TaxID=2164 RepID=UPI003C7433A1